MLKDIELDVEMEDQKKRKKKTRAVSQLQPSQLHFNSADLLLKEQPAMVCRSALQMHLHKCILPHQSLFGSDCICMRRFVYHCQIPIQILHIHSVLSELNLLVVAG